MGLQRFERRLERLVEGTFSKAFRSGGLQPVEIGRRVGREMDAGRTLGVRGTVAPNRFTVWLSNDDLERFSGFHEALARELADAAASTAATRATTSRASSRSRSWSTSRPAGATSGSTPRSSAAASNSFLSRVQ